MDFNIISDFGWQTPRPRVLGTRPSGDAAAAGLEGGGQRAPQTLAFLTGPGLTMYIHRALPVACAEAAGNVCMNEGIRF